jgi:restriction system protein
MPIPTFDALFNPLLEAMRNLGGSGSNAELAEEVARILALTDEDLEEQANRGQPRFSYRLAWARSYLKGYGLITNSERGVWSLTPKGAEVRTVGPDDVKRFVRSAYTRETPTSQETEESIDEPVIEHEWRDSLLKVLLDISPDQFERLCQRILRESGFVQVEVSGRSGDGGIDGTGIVELGGLLTFPILFQCKRYQGTVGASVVRDFRGAMVGRVDRGLILTTGVFSRDAYREATRDGAPPIDLVDRERLLDKLTLIRQNDYGGKPCRN